jgi:hypothetical protein
MRKENELFEEIEIPEGLEARMEALIDHLAEAEKRSKQKKTKQIWLWIGSVAAGIALLISAGVFYYSQNKINQPPVTQSNVVTDPKIACLETQKALELVSRNFNQGLNQLAMVTNELDKSNQILNKTLKR